jgi:hypothetical protein
VFCPRCLNLRPFLVRRPREAKHSFASSISWLQSSFYSRRLPKIQRLSARKPIPFGCAIQRYRPTAKRSLSPFADTFSRSRSQAEQLPPSLQDPLTIQIRSGHRTVESWHSLRIDTVTMTCSSFPVRGVQLEDSRPIQRTQYPQLSRLTGKTFFSMHTKWRAHKAPCFLSGFFRNSTKSP